MSKPFVHLHVHSEYSLLDGANRCADLAKETSAMGMNAVALTDHGVMYGCVDFYNQCVSKNVKPILGCEVYVDPRGHTLRDEKGQFHLVLLAENQEGYHNLVKLVSIANTDGFYYKPRIDHELLAKYSKGIIGASACLGGEIPRLIAAGDEQGALERAMLYRDILGPDNFFLEIQHNKIPTQALVNKTLASWAKKESFKLIATNDAHYMKQSDAEWHDVLLCVQTNSNVNDTDRYRFTGDDFYFRSPEEMWNIFGDELPDSLTNTQAIADRCNVELKSGKYHLPHFDIPEGETLATFLEKQSWSGLCERLGTKDVPGEYEARLKFELNVINQMDFPGYFCIVSDIISAAKGMGIPVGPGRGSAAGSLVAWSLQITDLDPIAHNLLFERFLNPERISMPDIDTDISDKGRDEVIAYIVKKYGADHVAQIITFGRMMSKNAVHDTGRAMGMTYADRDRVAKLIPDALKSGIKNIPDAIAKTPDLKALYDAEPQVRKLLDTASHIEGLARHTSQHAAGIVITPEPTIDMVPVKRFGENQIVTQYSMEPVEKLGLVKMDFLGLRTLSIIEGALANIAANGYEKLDLEHIPMDDPKVFEMLRAGDTLGVFQLESSGMRDLVRRLAPDRFEDIVALLALYRPGPLESGMADQYVERKHGREKVEYLHPLLSESLSETYGVILYQEQVMQCAARLAGYSLGEADMLRRAMGKKKVEVMAAERTTFVDRAEKNNVDRAKAAEIFDIIEKFAGYGFNKSHSAAYGLISYQTAYLKAHYGAEFFAAYLSGIVGSKMDVVGRYIRDVRSLGYEVLSPDINKSRADFAAVDGVILFGLSGVAKAGEAAVENIIKVRASGGPFKSFWDFMSRVDLRVVNKGVLENLVKSGAFDEIELNRRRLLDAIPALVEAASRREECANQRSLFAECDDDFGEPEMPVVEDFDMRTKLELEKESMGIYISGHPFEQYERAAMKYATCSIEDLPHWCSNDQPPAVLALLVEIKEKYTKKGDPMGILQFEDAQNRVEVVCFPRQWVNIKPQLTIGSPYVITGGVKQDGDLSLILDDLRSLEEAESTMQPMVRIKVHTEGLSDSFYNDLYRELREAAGTSRVLLDLETEDRNVVFILKSLRISGSSYLEERIRNFSGGSAKILT